MNISEDEWRLVQLSRCLTALDRKELMVGLGRKLLAQFCLNETLYDFMPEVGGYDPKIESSLGEIIRSGIQQSGDLTEVLLGIAEWDTEGPIDGFVRGATEIANRQGSLFEYDKQFAATYLQSWRWEIVSAIMSRATDAGAYANLACPEPNSVSVQVSKR